VPGLFFLKITLRSGAVTELGFEDQRRALVARDVIVAPLADGLSAIGEPPRMIMDDFDHAFSVRADDVAACMFVDLGAELVMGQKVAAMRQSAQEAYNEMQKRRQAGAGRLLVPAGAVSGGGPVLKRRQDGVGP
jgi:hypothetical protein